MSTLLKKLTLSFLTALIVLFSFAPYWQAVAADQPAVWYDSNFKDWFIKVYDKKVSPENEIFGERYTSAQVQWVIYSIWSFIINFFVPSSITASLLSGDLVSPKDLLNLLSSTPSPTLAKQGNQNILNLVFATDRTLSGIGYINNKLQNFNLVPTVSAQGFGYESLNNVQEMWTASRDIAFGFFVIIAIIFAFMIMFRVKISPQVVITVQSAIPKMIIALILVTFSYAIAGFLVDLMYVVIGLFSVIAANGNLIPTIPIIQPTEYGASEVFKLLTEGQTPQKIIGSTNVGGILYMLFLYLSPLSLILIVLFAVAILLSGTGLGTLPAIILFVAILLVAILAIWMGIKIIWVLFKAFANIVLLTIFAPIQITLGTLIPNFGFNQWLKSYLSYLSVFVVTGALWLIAWIFSLWSWNQLINLGGAFFEPAQVSRSWPPLLGSSPLGLVFVYAGVSFVMFTLIPKSTEIIQGFVSGRPFAYGSAIGETFSPITAAWGSAPVKGIREIESVRATHTIGGTVGDILISLGQQNLGDNVKKSVERLQKVTRT